ncbi:MAG: cation-transporting P-type ATPase, partial [Sulfurihydrogenibium sp.]
MDILELARKLNTDLEKGLTQKEAQKRLKLYGYNTVEDKRSFSDIKLFLNQFKSPFILLLLAAATLSFFLGDEFESIII